MGDLLGPELLKKVKVTKKTKEVLKGCDLVALYFSASWCPPCKRFTPILSQFYEKHCKPNNIEIVFVSSDRDVPSFEGYYGKMPWLSMPVMSADRKQKLANTFKIQGIPALVILTKDGLFVSDDGRAEVDSCGDDEEKKKALVTGWKSKEALPLDVAPIGAAGGGQSSMVYTIVTYFLKNPMYIFGMIYIVKQILKKLNELGQQDNDGGGGGEEEL